MNEDFKNAAQTGMQASQDAFATTSEKIQTFGKEITEMSKQSLQHATSTMEKLSKARTFEELMSVQTSFVTEMLQATTERTRKIGEMMTALPMDVTKAYQEALAKTTGTAKQAANQTTHEIINH